MADQLLLIYEYQFLTLIMISQIIITFQSENVTISHSNNTLILELKRLSTGSAAAVDTTGRCINPIADLKSASNAVFQTIL